MQKASTHPSVVKTPPSSARCSSMVAAISYVCCVATPSHLLAEYPTPGLGPLAPVNVGGMTFANYWKPSHTGMKSLLQNGLEFYSKAAVGRAEPHREPAPISLVGPLTWLMPLDQAVKTLPANHDRLVEQNMVSDCFPKDSLTVVGVHVSGSSFTDRGQQFDWMYLVVDKQRRLVGVELVALTPRGVLPWMRLPPGPGSFFGRLEPYYDFINMANNASTTQHVEYETAPAGKGVKLIHTALFRGTQCLKNVHWYLAAPFARVLLDLADYQHQAGR